MRLTISAVVPAALLALLLIVAACCADTDAALLLLGIVPAGLSSKELLEKRGEFIDQAKAMLAVAEKEDRDFTAEENRQFNELMDDAEECQRQVDEMYAQADSIAQRHARIENATNQSSGNRAADLLRNQGTAASRDLPGEYNGGRVMFRDERTGADVRAFAFNEPMGNPRDSIDVGRVIYAQMTGRLDMLNPHEIQAMGSHDTGGGYLLTPRLSQSVIDLARSASVVMRAGAMTVPMDTAEMSMARVTGDPTSHWRHEGVRVTATDMTFDRITLRARTLAAIIPVPIELLEDASNAAAAINNALQASMGLKLDQAAMLGVGAAAEPQGIINTANVNEVATVGTPTNYAEVSAAVGDVLNANYPGEVENLAWVLHPRDAETYDKLLDSDGNPLTVPPWPNALRRFHTTSLPTTDGGGSNESTMILGDFSQVVIGMRTRGVVIRVLDAGTVTDANSVTHQAAGELKRLIVAYLRADVCVIRPTWLTKLTGVTV